MEPSPARYDDKDQTKAALAERQRPTVRRRPATWGTWLLITTNLVVYAVTCWLSRSWQPAGEVLAEGWNEHSLVAAGQTWRLLSACFLHAGLLHIGMNLWVLYQIGTLLELLVGTSMFFVLYLATGLAGGWLSFRLGHAPSVGASGAVLGLAGVALAIGRLHRPRLSPPLAAALGKSMLIWVLSVLVLGVVIPRVDNYSHLGGLLAGLLLGPLARLRDGSTVPAWRRRTEGALAVAGLVLLVAVGSQAVRVNQGEPTLQRHEFASLGVTVSLPAGWQTKPNAEGDIEAERPGLPAKLVLERLPLPRPLTPPEQQRWIAQGLTGVRRLDGPRRVTLGSGVAVWYVRLQPADVIDWYLWFGDDAVIRFNGVMLSERTRTYGPLFASIADSLRVGG